ncbi:MAG: hypothetical protein Q7Q73_02250 [Verrucomicrobiota bacterium JB024]|nr:hypothetical protein [Verrucomicrobiota bacterium JB024]
MWDWLKKVGGWILDALKHFVDWLLEKASDLVEPFMEALLSAMPESVQQGAELLKPYVNMVNYWIPLDLAIVLITAYLGIWVSTFIVRTIVKIIPTVG